MAGSRRPKSPALPYHHGDLRRVLLDNAQAILAETDSWDFSLREVARRAGVSHNAPYRHFPDKEALLSAIRIAGYEALGERSARAIQGLTAPVDLLAAMGTAYTAFGIANPALYRLMFGRGLATAEEPSPALRHAISVARSGLHGVILAGATDGSFAIDPDDVGEVRAGFIGAWSLVHGLTLLTIDRLIERDDGPDTIQNLSDYVVDLFVAGLRSKTRNLDKSV